MENLIEQLICRARWIFTPVGGLLVTVMMSSYENFVLALDPLTRQSH